MSELNPRQFAVEAGKRIVRSLRANSFFVVGWNQIDNGVGKEYFERLFTEIVENAYRNNSPTNEQQTCKWCEFEYTEDMCAYCKRAIREDLYIMYSERDKKE